MQNDQAQMNLGTIIHHTPMLTVVSHAFAPQVSGSAVLLANLLSHYKGRITAIAGYHRYSKSDPAFKPPCHTRYLAQPRVLSLVYSRVRKAFPTLLNRSIRGSIQKAFKEFRTDVVLAAQPFADVFVASFLAARKLDLPFYAYMHDLWLENVASGTPAALFAERWEPIILKESTRVLCITEAMQSHYEAKYGIRTNLLPHTVPDQHCLDAPSEMRPPKMEKPTVLFVGAPDPHFNLDALKVLARASELLPRDYDLLYCTPVDLPSLNRLGIQSNRLRVQYVTRAEVQRLQSEAHVLLAPLSHKNCSIDEVRTVFSTKLLEYLVAGRPIIVFAPEDSYHARSAKRNGWAYVVTEDSPLALAAAILKVVTDQTLSARIVKGALREAHSRMAGNHAARLHRWALGDFQKSFSHSYDTKTEDTRCGLA